MNEGLKAEIMASFEQAIDGHLLYAKSVSTAAIDTAEIVDAAVDLVRHVDFMDRSEFGRSSPDTAWDWMCGAASRLEGILKRHGIETDGWGEDLEQWENEHLERMESQ